MRFAIIRNGIVDNVLEAEADFTPDDDSIAVASDLAGPGWTWDGAAFHAPAPRGEPVPQAVSMFQAREALRRTAASGGGTLLDQVNAFVATHSAEIPTLALAWEYATEVRRDGEFVASLSGVLALDAAALDALFRQAAAISA